jgi:Fe-S-cluster containining protein
LKEIEEEEFKRLYTRMVDGQLCLIDRPKTNACVFLKDNRCSVYDARPVQCRTFPWWLHTIQSEKSWKEAGEDCEGINHPDAPLIPGKDIAIQCTTYLDNLIEQNFRFDPSK